jgi:uncharacterized membrane protein
VGFNFFFEDYLLFPELLSFWLSVAYLMLRIVLNIKRNEEYGSSISSDGLFDGGGGGFCGGGDGGCGGGD